MAGTVKLTRDEFKKVWEQIKQDHPVSVWAISWKMKAVLGCSVREYTEYHEIGRDTNNRAYGKNVTYMCLDFWDDQLEIFFRLRYL
jgi:hypothetical protein